MLKMSLSTFSGSFFHEATYRRSGRFLDEAIWQEKKVLVLVIVLVSGKEEPGVMGTGRANCCLTEYRLHAKAFFYIIHP
jgi:hypothetical protein